MSTPTRRTIAKGAAWAIPAVSLAAAAPAASASTSQYVTVTLAGVCKLDPHNHGRGKRVRLTLNFSSPEPVFVLWVSVADVTTGVNRFCVDGALTTAPVPSKALSGPHTPVSIAYLQGHRVCTTVLAHGEISDCRSV